MMMWSVTMDKIQLIHKYRRLLSIGSVRANRHNKRDSPTLPPPDIDLSPLLTDLVTAEYVSELFPDGPIPWHQRMVREMMGKPRLSMLNCACIIYARRNPKKPDLALELLREFGVNNQKVFRKYYLCVGSLQRFKHLRFVQKTSKKNQSATSGLLTGRSSKSMKPSV